MIVLRRPIGVHSLLEDYMFKNVKSIWNTWNLNWYIGSFIFSVLTILLIPFWIYMIAMDFWEWFSSHAANQETKRKDWRELYNVRKILGEHKELKSYMYSVDKYVLSISQIDDETISIDYKINENLFVRRICKIEEFAPSFPFYTTNRQILARFNIPHRSRPTARYDLI